MVWCPATDDGVVGWSAALRLPWRDLADAVSKPVVWVVGALFGQYPLDPVDAAILVTMLGQSERVVPILAAAPRCGALPTTVPTDPASCRVYEVLRVYGAVIHD
jgi:cyanate lyase